MNFSLQKRTKLACALFSLPIPCNSVPSGEDSVKNGTRVCSEKKTLHKLLLVGYKKSGTSTIFKQVMSVVTGDCITCFINFQVMIMFDILVIYGVNLDFRLSFLLDWCLG